MWMLILLHEKYMRQRVNGCLLALALLCDLQSLTYKFDLKLSLSI